MAEPQPEQPVDYARLIAERSKAVEGATKRLYENLPTYRSYANPDNPRDTAQRRMGEAVRATWMHGDPVRGMIEELAKAKGVDPDIIHALAAVEQHGNMTPGDYSKKSGAGAAGLMQLTPATAKRWNANVDDPRDSIRAAVDVVAELSERLGTKDPLFIAAAYNAGDKVVRDYAQAVNDLPLETKNYVAMFDIARTAIQDPNRKGTK